MIGGTFGFPNPEARISNLAPTRTRESKLQANCRGFLGGKRKRPTDFPKVFNLQAESAGGFYLAI
jgi:hypothetical protein